jgi:heme oxygenase
MSSDLNLLTYLKVLKVWVEAWSNLEEAILQSAFAEELQWMLPGSRSKLGITELNTLAVKYGFSAIQSDFVIKGSFQITPSVGALVGTCYVMRGAELGGKIIGKHLHSTLALPDIVFTSFYTADNVEQKQWGAWQKKCNEFLNSQCLIFDAVSGAKDTYAFLINSFTRDIPIS